ncbi:hypothetical protein [Deinococcus roseus]|uniref:hypothetical protein n=1 Tax=Deinococcus roseus TaxID=392414 RepID=UPI00166B70D2|nr:hypothetical protein [Deinococcus roseus]
MGNDIVQVFNSELLQSRPGLILISPGFTTTLTFDQNIDLGRTGLPSCIEVETDETYMREIEIRAAKGVTSCESNIRLRLEGGRTQHFIFKVSDKIPKTPRQYNSVSPKSKVNVPQEQPEGAKNDIASEPDPYAPKATPAPKTAPKTLSKGDQKVQEALQNRKDTQSNIQPTEQLIIDTRATIKASETEVRKGNEASWLDLALNPVKDKTGKVTIYFNYTNLGESVVSINPENLQVKVGATTVKSTLLSSKPGLIKLQPQESTQGLIELGQVDVNTLNKVNLIWKVTNLSTGEMYAYDRIFSVQ